MIDGIINEILILRTPVIITIAATAVMFFAFLIGIRRVSLTGKAAKNLGIFVGLDGRSALHLSFAWTKYVFFCATIVIMQTATLGFYLMIGALAIASAFIARETKLIILEFMGGFINIASVWVCTVFSEYIQNVYTDAYMQATYWIIVLFLVLCSTVILLYELICISMERSALETNRKEK